MACLKEKASEKPVLLYLHSLGAAIPRALNLALQLQRYFNNCYKITNVVRGNSYLKGKSKDMDKVDSNDYYFFRRYGSRIHLDTTTSTVELTDDFEPIVFENLNSDANAPLTRTR